MANPNRMSRLLQIGFLAALTCSARGGELTAAERKAIFLESPPPEYPVFLQARQLTGEGVYRLSIDEQGKVTKVTAVKSMDFPLCDSEAIKGLMRWKARPGQRREVDVPVVFSMPVNRLFISPAGAKVIKINGNLKAPLKMNLPVVEGQPSRNLVYTPRRVSAQRYSAVAFVAEGMTDDEANRNFAAWLLKPHESLAFWNIGSQRL